jgi:hypothetical protein
MRVSLLASTGSHCSSYSNGPCCRPIDNLHISISVQFVLSIYECRSVVEHQCTDVCNILVTIRDRNRGIPDHGIVSAAAAVTRIGDARRELGVQTTTFLKGHSWDSSKTGEKFVVVLYSPTPLQTLSMLDLTSHHSKVQNNPKNI